MNDPTYKGAKDINMKEYKCESCKHQQIYVLGPDECGSGNIDGRCIKDHWQGIGLVDENYSSSNWDNCADYERI